MTLPNQMWVEGYKAPIHRSLWVRILTWGAPRMWSGVWVLLCLMATRGRLPCLRRGSISCP